jgi:hypothetical protein
MTKNLVIVYSAGSCGDLVSIPWISSNQFYSVISKHTISNSGRALPSYNEEFIKQFPKQKFKHHYTRDWSLDLPQLDILDKPFLILTVLPEQAILIKNHFSDNVYILSINYSKDQWPFVASSFCSKVLDYPDYLTNDDVGENFLNTVAKNQKSREQFIYLGKHGLLGQWYAKKLLANESHYPPKTFTFSGDYNLQLKDIFDFNKFSLELEQIAKQVGVTLDLDIFKEFYFAWINKQHQSSEIKKLFTE